MIAGIGLAVGCIIYAFCSVPGVHWMGSCVALVIIIGGFITFRFAFTGVGLILSTREYNDDLYHRFRLVSAEPA